MHSTPQKFQSRTMRVKAIRDLQTGLFLGDDGFWTRQPRRAQAFLDELSAREVLAKLEVSSADLVTLNEEGRVVGGTPLRIQDG